MGQIDVFDTTNELLDKYARKYSLTTDYQLAKHLGCTTGTISNYRNHKTKMDPTTCVQIAEALRLDPMLIIAKIKMESDPTKREGNVWGKYAGRAFFLAAIISSLLTSYDNAYAQNGLNPTGNIYIIRTFRNIERRPATGRHPDSACLAVCDASRSTLDCCTRLNDFVRVARHLTCSQLSPFLFTTLTSKKRTPIDY